MDAMDAILALALVSGTGIIPESPMWKRLRQPWSVKEMVIVVGLVSLAAGVGYGVYVAATTFWHRRMAERAIPAALAGVRVQRDELIRSIEAYKQHFGFYPPLQTVPGPGRGVMNPLCYELAGVQFDPVKGTFHVSLTKDPMTIAQVQRFFNMSSFSNCVAFPAVPASFLPGRSASVSPLNSEDGLLGVALNYTEFTAEEFWRDFDFSPWRYATNPAEHNPGKFDLWVDLDVVGKHFTVGNWPEVK
jgi:hypothetical protein